MNIREAIELLQTMPGHWEFVVDGGGEAPERTGGRDYRITVDIQSDNFPTQGGMAVLKMMQGSTMSRAHFSPDRPEAAP